MRCQLERTLWATAFLAVLLAPALLAPVLHGPRTGDSSSLLSQLSVGMGLLATSLLVCAVVLPSRVRSLTRTLGIDGVLGIHRFVGLAVTLLVGLHIILVLAAKPGNVALFDILHAPNRARAAVGATVALAALVALTVLRRRLRQRYEVWRWAHLALAGSVLVLSALHIWWLNHLVRDTAMRALFTVLAVTALGVLGYRWLWLPIFGPRREMIVWRRGGASPPELKELLEGREAVGGLVTLYICENYTCSLPLVGLDAINAATISLTHPDRAASGTQAK